MPWNIADEHIQEAMRRGDFDNLKGAGKPLNFDDETGIPEEWRMAYRIMKDNEIVPEWISLRKEIQQEIEGTREKLRYAAQAYKGEMARLAEENNPLLKQLDAKQGWRKAQNDFRKRIEEINQKIKNYNLKVPNTSMTRDLLDAEREIARHEV